MHKPYNGHFEAVETMGDMWILRWRILQNADLHL